MWLEPQMIGDGALDRLTLGITGEIAAGNAAQGFEDTRRAGEGVLVEVEAEAATVAEGRVVLLHAANGGGGLRALKFDVSHGRLARESSPRVLSGLRRSQGERRLGRTAGRLVRNIPELSRA